MERGIIKRVLLIDGILAVEFNGGGYYEFKRFTTEELFLLLTAEKQHFVTEIDIDEKYERLKRVTIEIPFAQK